MKDAEPHTCLREQLKRLEVAVLKTVQTNDVLDFREDKEEVLYRSNIQVADLNALNATMAVLRWKQFMGFYSDQQQAHNLSFALSLQSLGRAECPPFTG